MGCLFVNGEILTLNARDELAEALLTAGEEIYFVGELEDALSLAEESTEVIDLGGRALLSLGAFRLFPEIARLTDDWQEVPSLLRRLGGDCLEWGSSTALVILSGRVIGCPPTRLSALSPNAPGAARHRTLGELLGEAKVRV